jgi:hypothetical protein
MLWVRTKMNFGPNYITNHNLRASKLLGIEFDFWLEFIDKIVEYNQAGKILFRARREEGDYGIQDTVFDSAESYAEYFEYVNGTRVEEAIIANGYDFIKTQTEIGTLDEVIYERSLSDSYIMLIAPGYEHLLANGDL